MPGQLLRPEDRLRFEELLARGTSDLLARRARILLLYDEGLPTGEISGKVGLSRGQTRYWRRQYRRRGMAILAGHSDKRKPAPFSRSHTQEGQASGRIPAVQAYPARDEEKMQAQTSMTPQPAGPHEGKNQVERQHVEHISGLAEALFDQTQPYHKMSPDRRRILREAALLHQMPSGSSAKGTIRSIHNQISTQSQQDLSPEEQTALAIILSYRERKIKKKSLASPNLSPSWQKDIPSLIALLRVAHALDVSRGGQTQISQVELGPGGLWVVTDGPQAAEDTAAAQQETGLWDSLGFPKMNILEASQAQGKLIKYPPLPKPAEQVGIEPTDAMAEAGRKVMRYHFAEMLRHEKGTRQGEDIEALHDMRVATRRMRAAFEVFEEAFDPKALKPHLKGLRATGRALGHVRDLDVFMEKARHYLDTLPEEQRPGLDPLLADWSRQREDARAEMLAHLDSPQYQTFKQEYNVFLSTPGAGARPVSQDPPAPSLVREIAPVLIYNRLAAVRAFDRILENARIDQLHALRIEFKKLRYTVEFFREVLGGEAKAVISDLKGLQDHLGDLNDANVATQILRQYLDEFDERQAALPVEERQNPQAVVSYLAARHAERYHLMVTFKEAWEYFNRPDFRRNLALAVSVL